MPVPPPPPPPPPLLAPAVGGPPPPPPPPAFSQGNTEQPKPKANEQKGRTALLADIQKGKQLKKVTQINDRSGPALDTPKSQSQDAGVSTCKSGPSATPLGGLFAGGFPVLKPAGQREGQGLKSAISPPGSQCQTPKLSNTDTGKAKSGVISPPVAENTRASKIPDSQARRSSLPVPPPPPPSHAKPIFSLPGTPNSSSSMPPQEKPSKLLPPPPPPPPLLNSKPTWHQSHQSSPSPPSPPLPPPPPPSIPASKLPDRLSGSFQFPPPPSMPDGHSRDSLVTPSPIPTFPTSKCTLTSPPPPPPPPPPSKLTVYTSKSDLHSVPPPPPPPSVTANATLAHRRPPAVPKGQGGGRLAPPVPPARSPSTELTSRSPVSSVTNWPLPPPPPPVFHTSLFSQNGQSCDDFESKFKFHSMDDFPPPDEFKPFPRIYPSKESKENSKPPVLRTHLR
ncbi:WAS/WASL-interacting protein family member 3 [Erpetoichthys calabaricus]|uniref:WAS/WASL-interacting protein family member 3 n=1 Tax=Erpetoichthys calabaricus TaxID=27687 RepID=UPI0022346024|nr:WAS/WASL-interacting protein family member 3 [Erpetoichthys calabaricus]XP_051791870.1 WAS/WASL-interacting protein family member 3 [Erpetoichthys calabaricus]